jgi:hypothetical protein
MLLEAASTDHTDRNIGLHHDRVDARADLFDVTWAQSMLATHPEAGIDCTLRTRVIPSAQAVRCASSLSMQDIAAFGAPGKRGLTRAERQSAIASSAPLRRQK